MEKKINTKGILCLEPFDSHCEWYWGSDYLHGDLYEAEQLFQDQHQITGNRLIFVHYPDGAVIEPIQRKDGQYFGKPIFFEGKLWILLVDFFKSLIEIFQYDYKKKEIKALTSLPRSAVKDCYNLMLHRSPLLLTRQANDGIFEIFYPEKVEIAIGETESFCVKKEDKLYFSRWFEDPDYREEIVVRKYPTGEIVDIISGALYMMPNDEMWILQ